MRLIKLTVLALLVSGQVCAETIAEREIKILEKAQQFKDHTLFYYLIPEGTMALSDAFQGLEKGCWENTNPENNEICNSQKIAVVERLKKYGFKDAKIEEFNNYNLYLLYKELEMFFKKKYQAISNMSLKAGRKDLALKKELAAKAGKMFSDRLLHLDELHQGKKGN